MIQIQMNQLDAENVVYSQLVNYQISMYQGKFVTNFFKIAINYLHATVKLPLHDKWNSRKMIVRLVGIGLSETQDHPLHLIQDSVNVF